jgi:hypothetical protein
MEKIEIVVITPEMAKALLEKNIGNRNVSIPHVKSLSRMMSDGSFLFNGDAIRIDTDGIILDGQHRLMACVKSGVPFKTVLATGLPRQVFATIDQQSKRTAANTLFVAGEKNCKDLSATLGWIERYFIGDMITARSRFNNQQVLVLLEKYPEAREALAGLSRTKGLIYRSVAAACNYLFRKKDADLAEQFFEQLLSGAGLDEDSPIYVLREALMKNAIERNKHSQQYIMAIMIKTWNAMRKNERIKFLRFGKVGGTHESFPIVQ